MTIEKVIEICKNIAKENNFNLNCPISANKRFTSTLGRVTYIEGGIEKIEFSKKLLDFGTNEQILDTIYHELAHAFVYLKTGENHGHDSIWKQMAKSLGATPERNANGNVWIKPEDQMHKYTIYCKKYGKFIAGKDRACKITKEPYNYISNCCNGSLTVVQNW